MVRDILFSTDQLEADAKTLQDELAVMVELIQKCINENARIVINQKEYQARYDGLVERFDKAKTQLDEIEEQISDKRARGKKLDCFIHDLKKQDGLITEFDERLWFSLVDFGTVYTAEDVRFTFKDGTEIQV